MLSLGIKNTRAQIVTQENHFYVSEEGKKRKPEKMQKDATLYNNAFGEVLFQSCYLTHSVNAEDA